MDLPAAGDGRRKPSGFLPWVLKPCAGIKPDAGSHSRRSPTLHSAMQVISNVISELDQCDAVIPGLPVADTMKFAPGGVIERTVDRGSMWFVQTPQGFTFDKILEAHRQRRARRPDQFHRRCRRRRICWHAGAHRCWRSGEPQTHHLP